MADTSYQNGTWNFLDGTSAPELRAYQEQRANTLDSQKQLFTDQIANLSGEMGRGIRDYIDRAIDEKLQTMKQGEKLEESGKELRGY